MGWLYGWSLSSLGDLILSMFSISMLVGTSALIIAIMTPAFITRFVGPQLRTIAFAVAAAAFASSYFYGTGFNDGLVSKQSDWDKAVQLEAKRGEEIRSDVEAAVPPIVDDAARRVLRSDPYNRDRGEQ